MAIFLKVYFTDFTTTLEDSIVGKNENKSEVSEAFLERRKNKPHRFCLPNNLSLLYIEHFDETDPEKNNLVRSRHCHIAKSFLSESIYT